MRFHQHAPVLVLLLLIQLGIACPAVAEPIPITARPVSELAIYPELRAPATVLSLNNSRLSAEISARVTDLPVQVGQIVAKDSVLARLDDTDYQLTLDMAKAGAKAIQARIDLARYELQRARTLSQKQAVSEQLLKQREAELKTLLAEQDGQLVAIRIAERNLAKTVLIAPYQSIVKARLGQLGELASPGTPLLEIVDATQLEVSAQVQGKLTESLAEASNIRLQVNGDNYPLRLRVLTPVIDPQMRTREARLVFTANNALPGSAGEVVWQNHQAYLPAELLVKRNGQLGIFTVEGDQAVFSTLPNAEEGRPAPSKLAPNTLVIIQGRFKLQDGDRIQAQ